MPRNIDDVIMNTSLTESARSKCGVCSEAKELLVSEIKVLNQRIMNLEAQNRVMMNQQEKILAMVSCQRVEEDMELDDVKLPIKDEDELQKLHVTLSEKDKRRQLSSVLSVCASESVPATTRSIMRKTISNSLAQRLNWAGKGCVGKVPFSKQEHLLKVIYGKDQFIYLLPYFVIYSFKRT